jgi:hypothetical protein
MKEPFKFSDLQETELHILLTPLALAKRNNAIERIEQIVSEQILSSREDVERGEGEAEVWNIVESIIGRCTCDVAYVSRQMTDPNCRWCDYHVDLIKSIQTYAAPFQAEIERLTKFYEIAGKANREANAEINKLNESLTVMLRKNTELESELAESNRTISNLRQRLADCQRRGLTGERL